MTIPTHIFFFFWNYNYIGKHERIEWSGGSEEWISISLENPPSLASCHIQLFWSYILLWRFAYWQHNLFHQNLNIYILYYIIWCKSPPSLLFFITLFLLLLFSFSRFLYLVSIDCTCIGYGFHCVVPFLIYFLSSFQFQTGGWVGPNQYKFKRLFEKFNHLLVLLLFIIIIIIILLFFNTLRAFPLQLSCSNTVHRHMYRVVFFFLYVISVIFFIFNV